MRKNKAQSISINTIIIAAIAIAVLVVTFIIFTKQTGITTKNLQSCELRGGECANKVSKDSKGISCQNNKEQYKDYNIPLIIDDTACGNSKLCCLKIG